MSDEKNTEKIYDLIELFDFDELNEEQKKFVLTEMTVADYEKMRTVITDTKNLFAKYPVDTKKETKNRFVKILKFPVELYKVAASVIVLLTLTFLFSEITLNTDKNENISKDTVFVTIIDTLIMKTTDTVEIIKEQVYNKKEITADINDINPENENIANVEIINEYKSGITPDDLEILGKLKTNGSLSQDSALSEFVVSIN